MQVRAFRQVFMGLVGFVAFAGCDSLATAIDGTAAALKEPDLPNTSKMLNCCVNLESKNLTKGLVANICPTLDTQVAKVITAYQTTKKGIQDNTNLTAADKTAALAKLKTESQASLEPAARCLLTETIGTLGNAAIPKDCEAVTTIGALPQGKTCDDAKTAITAAK